MQPSNFCTLMRQIDEAQEEAAKLGIYSKNIAFHCNGGLGRAPMVMVIRAIWNVFHDTKKAKKNVIADWKNQDMWKIDGKINLAAVLRNIMILGYYAPEYVRTK